MNDIQEQRKKLEGLVNPQIDPTSGLAINCHNCIHCERSDSGVQYDKCLKSGGRYCEFIHSYPSLHGHICRNYSSWSPRKGINLPVIPFFVKVPLFIFSFFILSFILSYSLGHLTSP